MERHLSASSRFARSSGIPGIVLHGDISFRSPRESARTMLYSTGHHHLHPALSKKRTLRPGLGSCPGLLRLINC